MKALRDRSTPLFVFAIYSFVTLAGPPATCSADDSPFTHPGILHSRAELDFVKAKVAEGEEPWKSAWEELRSHEGRYYYPKISGDSRGRFSSIYERVYHHYHDRMGLEMPFTAQVIEKIRPERWRSSHASWGTLMHARQPAN